MNLGTQIMALEDAQTNASTFAAMNAGTKALQRELAVTSVDKVDDVVDDLQTAMDANEEISDAMAQPMGNTDFDEDDLLAELDDLEDSEVEIEPEFILDDPVVPSHKVKAKKITEEKKVGKTEEEELAELDAMLAI